MSYSLYKPQFTMEFMQLWHFANGHGMIKCKNIQTPDGYLISKEETITISDKDVMQQLDLKLDEGYKIKFSTDISFTGSEIDFHDPEILITEDASAKANNGNNKTKWWQKLWKI